MNRVRTGSMNPYRLPSSGAKLSGRRFGWTDGIHRAASALLLLLTMVLAGCTNEDVKPGTLDEALGLADPQDPVAQLQAMADHESQIEELVAECMAQQGFEYLPRDIAPDPRAAGELTDEEYRRLYGYGMTHSTESSYRDLEGWGSPNEEHVASLDEETRFAWYRALNGDDPDDDARDGCRHQAEDEVTAFRFTDEWAEMERALADVEARISADPRTIAAQASWAGCMADAGYPFAQEDDAIEFLNEAIFDAWADEPHPETGQRTTHRDSIAPWFFETDTWSDLVEMELDIVARADACNEDPQVRDEYEREFVDEHAELLERVRDLRMPTGPS